MRKTPTLQQVTGNRPLCQCCHKPIKPYTSWFYMPGRFEQPPTLEEIQAARDAITNRGFSPLLPGPNDDYLPERVFRLHCKKNIHQAGPETQVSYWKGYYEGYGYGNDGLRLFCGTSCAVRFGVACYNAGMRIVEKQP